MCSLVCSCALWEQVIAHGDQQDASIYYWLSSRALDFIEHLTQSAARQLHDLKGKLGLALKLVEKVPMPRSDLVKKIHEHKDSAVG